MNRAALKRRWRCGLWLLAAAGSGIGAGAPPAAAGDLHAPGLPPGAIVREVRVAGCVRAEEAAVRRVLGTLPGAPLDAAMVRADLRRLLALGLFDDVRIEIEGDPADGIVVVTVVERPLVRRVAFDGNDALETEKLAPLLDVRPGA